MESLFEPKGLFFVSNHDDLWSRKRGVFLFFRSYGVDLSLFFLKMVFEEDNVLLLDGPTRNPSSFSLEMLDSLLNSFPGTVLFISHDVAFITRRKAKGLKLSLEGLQEAAL